MRTRLLAVGVALLAGACGDGAQVTPTQVGGEEPGAGWRPMAESPLSPRHSGVAAVVGSEVFVLGGQDEPLCPPNADCALPPVRLRDVAAYDVRTDTWRRRAAAPVPLSLGAETAVVGTTVYVLVPARGKAGVASFHAYDAVADRWTTLPAPAFTHLRLLAAGSTIIGYQSSHENGVPQVDQRYDTVARSWVALPADPLVPSFDRTMVYAGDRVVLLAPRLVPSPGGADGPSWLRAATLDVDSRTWTALPETRQVISGELTPVWSGGGVLNPSPGGADGGDTNGYGRTLPFGGRLDVRSGRWSALPALPSVAGKPLERYRGWGVSAASPVYSASGSIVFDAERDRWLSLPTPPDAPEQGHVAAWVDGRLVVWGGGSFDGGASTLSATGAVWTPPTA